MDADAFGDAAGKLTTITHGYKDDLASFQTLLQSAALGIGRIAKPAAHLYVFCDIDNFAFLRGLFSKLGNWNVFRTPLVLHKINSGRVPLPEFGPRRCYELILYAYVEGVVQLRYTLTLSVQQATTTSDTVPKSQWECTKTCLSGAVGQEIESVIHSLELALSSRLLMRFSSMLLGWKRRVTTTGSR